MAPFFAKFQKTGHTALTQQKHVTHTEVRKGSAQPEKFKHPIHNKTSQILTQKSRSTTPVTTHTVDEQKPKRPASPSEKPSKGRKRAHETPQRQDWGASDGELSDDDFSTIRKRRRKHEAVKPDPTRTIRSQTAFSDGEEHFPMIHAADIANSDKVKDYKLAFPVTPSANEAELQYPSGSQRERYGLVEPKADDEFKPLNEIREVIEMTIEHYLPTTLAEKLSNDSTGVVRRLKRAAQRAARPGSQETAGEEYLAVIDEWNQTLTELKVAGKLADVINDWKSVDLGLCERILTQTYARTVSLNVDELKHKQGSNVYGELLPKFISKILRDDTQMKANQIFVDLGSGVGNVVLQAALEIGCESWGCESEPAACKLADRQKKEFEARCRLWGLSKGAIRLKKGDFRTDEDVRAILPQADVVLVNNQVFDPELNDDLTRMFLDLKDGARVVSLKSFAPVGQQKQARTAGAVSNILDVKQKTYHSNSVSWTGGDGTYFVAIKDTSRMNDTP